MSYLSSLEDPLSIISPIEHGVTFPESMHLLHDRYREDIRLFKELVQSSRSSAELLRRIRDTGIPAKRRMSLLKLFRRCVSLVCDTETTKKIDKIPTETIVKKYGHTFKPIRVLKESFSALTAEEEASLAALIGEYDDRGKHGYILTELFFAWMEDNSPDLRIQGPRGAGKDIELSSIFPDFEGSYPCDFVITDKKSGRVLAIGFARYDSTRGGAQSDDRTGGNEVKVLKAAEFARKSGESFRIVFLADGPGLAHSDTWQEACSLDDSWGGNVRVVTLALCGERITRAWLSGR